MKPETSAKIWARGVVLALTLFALGTVTLVWSLRGTNIDLVHDDYYERTVDYQPHIEATARGNAPENALRTSYSQRRDTLYLHFPEGAIGGTVRLQRPSDRDMDRHLTLPDGTRGTYALPIPGLTPGLWRMEVEWTRNGTAIYTETRILY